MIRKSNLLSYFSEMKDPRIERTKRYLFDDIVFIKKTCSRLASGN